MEIEGVIKKNVKMDRWKKKFVLNFKWRPERPCSKEYKKKFLKKYSGKRNNVKWDSKQKRKEYRIIKKMEKENN